VFIRNALNLEPQNRSVTVVKVAMVHDEKKDEEMNLFAIRKGRTARIHTQQLTIVHDIKKKLVLKNEK